MESKFGFKYIELTLIWPTPRSRVIKINAKNYNLKLLMFHSGLLSGRGVGWTARTQGNVNI